MFSRLRRRLRAAEPPRNPHLRRDIGLPPVEPPSLRLWMNHGDDIRR